MSKGFYDFPRIITSRMWSLVSELETVAELDSMSILDDCVTSWLIHVIWS